MTEARRLFVIALQPLVLSKDRNGARRAASGVQAGRPFPLGKGTFAWTQGKGRDVPQAVVRMPHEGQAELTHQAT